MHQSMNAIKDTSFSGSDIDSRIQHGYVCKYNMTKPNVCTTVQ